MISLNLKSKGYPTLEELRSLGCYPSYDDFMKGPTAVIECIEEIPCNPCELTCKKNAIKIGQPITNLPKIDVTQCTGCSLCLSKCPGLAIYIKDYTYNENQSLIIFPYEFLPLPRISQKVMAVDRQGQVICEAIVTKINKNKTNDHTAIISMLYPKDLFHDVVSMKRL
ncbi:4Fe-4S binding protein [Cellulosilyticum sp. I15G10I2]|uniref:4Fe-4S binding protein n=1 Tax=Cellulosilyticum sp. I15G10I2 TaxID=1892843 RepID=UPI00085CB8FF|nr:4Fe-4S binding protein [Cellulosilyticum sp. I15G10I2]